jgi:hypothetical protein
MVTRPIRQDLSVTNQAIDPDYPSVAVFCKPCPTSMEPVRKCAEIKCCWMFARHGYEQRLRDDARIAEERERGPACR